MSIYSQDVPNLLHDIYDESWEVPIPFDQIHRGRASVEVTRWDWVWKSAKDYIEGCVGGGEPTADLLDAMIAELPPGRPRLRMRSNTAWYRRAERKLRDNAPIRETG